MHTPRALSRRVLVLALALLVALSAAACSEKRTPEQQIKAVLDAAVKALEEGDVNAASDLLAESYKDSNGRDRRQMKGIAFLALRRGPLHLSLSDENIEVDESKQRATVSLKVTALQTAGAPTTVGDLVPRGRAMEVQLSFVKEGEDWLVTAIDGDGMGRSDFE